MSRNILILIIVVISAACKNDCKRPGLEGAWKLVYAHYYGINKSYPEQFKGFSNKLITDGHFSLVGLYVEDSIRMAIYGTGSYTLDKNRYEEKIDYHFYKSFIGTTVKILIELRQDTLIQRFPANDSWQLGDNYDYEKWVRIK